MHNWCNLLANGFFQSPFEANKLFCLLNKLVFFNNHRQLLKCVKQNSYLDLWSYTSYIIWQGVHILVKLQAGGTNKYTTKMKSLTDIFQGFDKCTEVTLQTTIFDERLLMTASTLKHDTISLCYIKRWEFKTIFIWRSSRKINRNKNLLILYYLLKKLSKFSNAQKKFSMLFLFNLVWHFLFMFHFVKLLVLEFRNMSSSKSIYFSTDSLCFIYFDFIIH